MFPAMERTDSCAQGDTGHRPYHLNHLNYDFKRFDHRPDYPYGTNSGDQEALSTLSQILRERRIRPFGLGPRVPISEAYSLISRFRFRQLRCDHEELRSRVTISTGIIIP